MPAGSGAKKTKQKQNILSSAQDHITAYDVHTPKSEQLYLDPS